MRAGRLRHRVTLQTQSEERNSLGEVENTWEDWATVWGGVEPLRGRELMTDERNEAELTTRVIIRYRSGVVPSMRVVWGAHTYDIESVIDVDGRGRDLELMCREVVE